MTAKAGDRERQANSAMLQMEATDLAGFEKARRQYGQAAKDYRRAATYMETVDVPAGLESFCDLAAAQSG